ncbi:MAG TPA: hypothetical protein VGG74_00560 [Kofleriaceae bacterium]
MIAYILIAIALGGVAGVLGRRRARAAKLLADPATFEDNSAVTFIGTVKVVGEPLIAPLSGKPCVAFRVRARSYRPAAISVGVASSSFREIDQQQFVVEMMPFTLVTQHGEIAVDGEICELLIRGGAVIPRSVEREQDLLDQLQILARAADAGFDEACVEPGAQIKVHGLACRELSDRGGETGFREAPTQIRITGDDAHPIRIDRA